MLLLGQRKKFRREEVMTPRRQDVKLAELLALSAGHKDSNLLPLLYRTSTSSIDKAIPRRATGTRSHAYPKSNSYDSRLQQHPLTPDKADRKKIHEYLFRGTFKPHADDVAHSPPTVTSPLTSPSRGRPRRQKGLQPPQTPRNRHQEPLCPSPFPLSPTPSLTTPPPRSSKHANP